MLNHQSSDSLPFGVTPFHMAGPERFYPPSWFPDPCPRSESLPSRREPVASKAMLEANSRRRRHPAQFECADCNQTFTALFSLKREFSRILLRGFNL
jgi:hypothetical protein